MKGFRNSWLVPPGPPKDQMLLTTAPYTHGVSSCLMKAADGPEPHLVGPSAEFPAEIVEHRPDTPIESLTVLRRQKECGISIRKSEGPGLAELFRRERFHRQFGPGDQRPVFVQPQRHHSLVDFERVLGGLVGAIQKVGLVAQRQ